MQNSVKAKSVLSQKYFSTWLQMAFDNVLEMIFLAYFLASGSAFFVDISPQTNSGDAF